MKKYFVFLLTILTFTTIIVINNNMVYAEQGDGETLNNTNGWVLGNDYIDYGGGSFDLTNIPFSRPYYNLLDDGYLADNPLNNGNIYADNYDYNIYTNKLLIQTEILLPDYIFSPNKDNNWLLYTDSAISSKDFFALENHGDHEVSLNGIGIGDSSFNNLTNRLTYFYKEFSHNNVTGKPFGIYNIQGHIGNLNDMRDIGDKQTSTDMYLWLMLDTTNIQDYGITINNTFIHDFIEYNRLNIKQLISTFNLYNGTESEFNSDIKQHLMIGDYSDGFNAGYQTGINNGRLEGFIEGQESLGGEINDLRNEAYNNGYQTGYNLGLHDNQTNVYNGAYNKGYSDGQSNKFYASFEKWIVPAIIIVLVLGGVLYFKARGRWED